MDDTADSAHLDGMKATYLHALGAIALSFSIAACIPQAEQQAPVSPPSPTPTPAPVIAPMPTPATAPSPAVQEPVFEDYLDAPQTVGNWTYDKETGESFAVFGPAPAAPKVIIRCDLGSRLVGIGRFGVTASTAAMRIQTESANRVVDASSRESGAPLVAVELSAIDPILDAMAITKVRFSFGVEGMRTLYLPAWAEVTRVIEDCR